MHHLFFSWLLECVLISIFSLYSVFYHNCNVIAHVPYCTLHMKLLILLFKRHH